MSLPAESVCVDPLRVPDLPIAADILSKILNLDSNDLLARMTEAAANKHGFVWVKRKISAEESQRLRDLKLEWIEFRSESQRFYPNQSLAAHVIGGVDFAQKGNGGVEQSLDARLKGRSGELHVTRDVQKRDFASKVESQPQAGQDIRLTIDARIQFVAEREVKKMVLTHHAKWGSVVAMDPHTGDILALANFPTFDPNEPPKQEDLRARENLAVTAPFEPGSVFKVITLSAALETTKLRPETMINCGGGKITLFGRTIHDHNSYWALSMEDVLARSSNIGAINIGLTVGRTRCSTMCGVLASAPGPEFRFPANPRECFGRCAVGRKLRSLPSPWDMKSALPRSACARLCGDRERRIADTAALDHGYSSRAAGANS